MPCSPLRFISNFTVCGILLFAKMRTCGWKLAKSGIIVHFAASGGVLSDLRGDFGEQVHLVQVFGAGAQYEFNPRPCLPAVDRIL